MRAAKAQKGISRAAEHEGAIREHGAIKLREWRRADKETLRFWLKIIPRPAAAAVVGVTAARW